MQLLVEDGSLLRSFQHPHSLSSEQNIREGKRLHTPAAVSPISSPHEQALHQCVTSGDLSHLHENTWGTCETADSWTPSQPPCIRVPMGKIRFCFFPPKQGVASERQGRDLRPLEVKG